MLRNVTAVVLAIFCLVAGSWLGFRYGERRGQMAAKAQATPTVVAAADERRTNVEVQVLKPAPITELVMLPCTVEPVQDITLSSEISGRVESVGADEGEVVRKGSPLVVCDVRTLRAGLDEAESMKNLAELSLKRLKDLQLKGDFVPGTQLDKANADLESADARVRLTKLQIEKGTISSPIDGILDRRPVEAGEVVAPGQTLARVVDIAKVKVVACVPEVHVPYLKPGSMVQIQFPYLNGSFAPRPAAVTYLATMADAGTHTYRMEIELDNTDLTIRPGMMGSIYLTRRSAPEALSVPIFSVVAKGSRRTCAVEKEGKAEVRDVTLGLFDGKRIQVLSGLATGDRLIISGHRQLEAGDAVQVVKVVE